MDGPRLVNSFIEELASLTLERITQPHQPQSYYLAYIGMLTFRRDIFTLPKFTMPLNRFVRLENHEKMMEDSSKLLTLF